MKAIVRSASFSRRNKRAPTDPTNTEKAVDASAKPASFAGKIVRTASFSRKSKVPPPVNDDTEADNSSDSRSPTPPESPEDHDSLASVPSVMTDRLYGWLKKKSQGGKWSKRYFFVDETRGTLGYAKSHTGRSSKPSAVLPIADITKIEEVAGEPNAFVISCPPIHLTVAAVSVKERKNWMRQLELRAEVWRMRQAEKMPVANVQQLLSMANTDSPPNAPAAAAPAESRWPTCAAAQPARPKEERPQSPPASAADDEVVREQDEGARTRASAASVAMGGAGVLRNVPSVVFEARPVVPCRGVESHDPASVDASAPIDLSEPTEEETAAALRNPAAAAPRGEASPEPSQRRSRQERSQPAEQPAEPPPRAFERVAPPAKEAESMVETVELYSGDEDGESEDCAVNSANKASGGKGKEGGRASNASPPMRGPAPVPLAAMISSDEEESDDEALPPAAAPPPPRSSVRRNRAAAASSPTPPPARDESDDEESVVEEMSAAMRPRRRITGSFSPEEEAAKRRQAPPAAPAVAPAKDADSWDSSDSEDDEDDAIPTLASHQQSRRAHGDEPPSPPQPQAAASNVFGAPPPPPDTTVMAAPGIVADEGFAEEDWDDDE